MELSNAAELISTAPSEIFSRPSMNQRTASG